ncbi:hypothetical protein DITRI_Ditri11bG0030100 [Diplodiscus trichospermus]
MSEVVCGLQLELQLQESEINVSDSTVNDYHVLFTSGSGSMNVGRQHRCFNCLPIVILIPAFRELRTVP